MNSRKRTVWMRVLMICLIVILSAVAAIGTHAVTAYQNAKKELTEVTAVISSFKEEAGRYTSYVSYIYNDTEYIDVPYASHRSEPPVGEKVTVSLHPAAPGSVLPEAKNMVLWIVLSPLCLTVAAIAASALLLSWLPETEKETKTRRRLIPYLIVAGVLVLGSAVHGLLFGSMVFCYFAILPAVATPIIGRRLFRE